MQPLKKITAELLKKHLSPEHYYKTALNGSFGKATNNGWHAWNGLCPFHDDKKAGSFNVNKITGAFKCFSCGSGGGDIIDFYMQKEHVHFKEALSQLWGYVSCVK